MPEVTKFAHSNPRDVGEWHPLDAHLRDTAALARAFASGWGGGDMAYLAGLWHDLGKYAADWQGFLRTAGRDAHIEDSDDGHTHPSRRGPDHSSAGAVHAVRLGAEGMPVRFAIAGHHAGLADKEKLAARLNDRRERYDAAVREAPSEILDPRLAVSLPSFILNAPRERQARALETFTRFLFSALVDADFLDTEAYFLRSDPARANRPNRAAWRSLPEYLPVLDAHLARLTAQALPTPVNAQRRRVLAWCVEAAEGPCGAYSLTVPTGGGKTLAGLAFAVRHAVLHGMPRVVIALPFTSILDQTASVLRTVFEPALGENVLVEHHSTIDPTRETALNRVAAENWDAPLVVTTQVQLFESLFANRPRRCRKLHNLAGSVVVLDEVQTLPATLLEPILDQLRELTSCYRTTLLLTTATQPSLHSRLLGSKQFPGLEPEPTEIVPLSEMEPLFGAFRRVKVHWPRDARPIGLSELARTVMAHPRVLVVVDRRGDASALWREIRTAGDPDALHLSALMCPAHRQEVLGAVRRRLDDGVGCRLVSTQLIEAGVDIDFPVVYRAMAGLESLAQSAGRCNREGRLHSGDFFVFRPEKEPPGILRHHRDVASVMLAHDPELDLMSPLTFRMYFDRLYGHSETDGKHVQPLRQYLKFEATAAAFRMIDDVTETVFVPFGVRGRRAIRRFEVAGPSRWRLRGLQPFGVGVYPRTLRSLLARGQVATLHDTAHVLVTASAYDSALGLRDDALDDAALIV